MNINASDSYLATEVMTAAPQKLQLMLIEAAIRSVEAARRHWRENENQPAFHCLIRAQKIVGEILSSLDFEDRSDLVKNVAGIYLFILRSLMEAAADRDEKNLDDALRVLNVERETWRRICDKLGGKATGEQTEFIPAASESLPPAPVFNAFDDLPWTGFSVEA
ncbi:MAG: flagellar export chaperone FliS [Pirellulales bacterium]|nr:flagellar export chaperone FliS [Pirellulales bacterium]